MGLKIFEVKCLKVQEPFKRFTEEFHKISKRKNHQKKSLGQYNKTSVYRLRPSVKLNVKETFSKKKKKRSLAYRNPQKKSQMFFNFL